jgi:undecaprenyl-diphosphatase
VAPAVLSSPRWRPFARPRAAVVAASVVLLLTYELFALRAMPNAARLLDDLDAAWRDRMLAAEGPFGLALARFLQVAAGAWVTVPLRLLVAVALAARGAWGRFGFWVAAVVSSEVLLLVAKALYDRPRPPEQLSVTYNASFPSGHTAGAATIAFALAVAFLPPGRARRLGYLAALAWTVLVAWSRTYLRDHWLSDTLGGALLGLLCVLAAALWPYGTSRKSAPAA